MIGLNIKNYAGKIENVPIADNHLKRLIFALGAAEHGIVAWNVKKSTGKVTTNKIALNKIFFEISLNLKSFSKNVLQQKKVHFWAEEFLTY